MIQEHALHSLRTLLHPKQVFTDKATLIAYEADAGLDKGLPDAVVFPRTREEVERVVRWAAEHQVALIARGAGTGLSGGAVADRGGVIVEFVHMDAILDIDPQGRCAVVEPALINLRLDEAVKAHDLYFPPDPASQRAATIGGNVAENSGGPHCFKYGVTTNYVTGLAVVTANGERVRLGGRALDYPEYDLCGLVTGSEGTLALITAVTVRLVRNPPGVKTLLAVFDSVERAGEAVSAVIAAGLVPATMEMMDSQIVRIIEPFAHAGLPLDAGAILIVEIDGHVESLAAQMHEIVQVLEHYGGHSMRIARDEEERARIWKARKSAGGAIAREVPAYYTIDITVPRSRLSEMLHEVYRICERNEIRAGQLFHAGDGNLHPMLLIPDPDDPALLQRVHRAGYEMVKYCVEMGGSLTGEHGVGIEKREFMSLMHTPDELRAMQDIKQVFDPAGLFNPGKIFPALVPHAHSPLKFVPMEANLTPMSDHNVLLPSTPEEAAQQLLALSSERKPVVIQNMHETSLLQQYTDNSACILSTRALSGIKAYAPDDLVITVGAGTPLREIQPFLAQHRQQLALVSPWPDATVGGLVATNTNAPLRMRYGALRDQVLCMTVALPDGSVIRTGRSLVKNVAGYDLTKAFIGSYGTLGLICDITLKISAQPREQCTILIPVETREQGMQFGQQLMSVALTASAVILCKSNALPEWSWSNYVLVYTVEGMPEDVRAELAQVRDLRARLQASGGQRKARAESAQEGVGSAQAGGGSAQAGGGSAQGTIPTGCQLWANILGARSENSIIVRTGVPIKSLGEYVQECAALIDSGDWIVDLANGFVYTIHKSRSADETVRWLNALRAPALKREGYAVVMDMPALPESTTNGLDRWGYQPHSLQIMERLQACWDPASILNPELFLAR
jgi:D-lactate dehydrogenase (cytochrome)